VRHYCRLFALVLLLPLIVAGPAFARQDPPKEPAKDVKVDGVWSLTVSSPMGEQTNDSIFKQDGEKLKITMTGPQGTLDCEGTIKDGIVEWVLAIDTPNGTFSIVFKGKVEGDKMSGEAGMGEFGTAGWSAVRKK